MILKSKETSSNHLKLPLCSIFVRNSEAFLEKNLFLSRDEKLQQSDFPASLISTLVEQKVYVATCMEVPDKIGALWII